MLVVQRTGCYGRFSGLPNSAGISGLRSPDYDMIPGLLFAGT